MAVLITGGCGFIGSNFVLDWVAQNDEPLINLDKLTYAGNLSNLRSIEGSNQYHFVHAGIEDSDAVGQLLREYHIRAVVNFAAESHVDRSIDGPEPFIQTNMLGTFRLLETVRAYWSGLGDEEADTFRFINVSTDEVFGTLDPDEPPFTEDSPLRPNSPYAASKAGADHLVRSYGETYHLPALTTHCSNNYGPLHFPEKLIPLIIHNALTGKDLPIYGDGQQVRDWLYVGDHCAALRRVLEAGRPGESYNVGGNSERRNIDVVRSICAILDAERPRTDGQSYATQIAFVKDRPGHDRRYAIDARKIRRDLGWTPKQTFESGLLKTVRWYLENSSWVEDVATGAYRDWVAKQYT